MTYYYYHAESDCYFKQDSPYKKDTPVNEITEEKYLANKN